MEKKIGTRSGNPCPKCGTGLLWARTRYSVAQHCPMPRCKGRICAPRGSSVAAQFTPDRQRVEAIKMFCKMMGIETVREALGELAPDPKPVELDLNDLLAEIKRRVAT